MTLTRRQTLELGAASMVAVATPSLDQSLAQTTAQTSAPAAAQEWIETHGLSSFGDLALPPDFKHFEAVNSDAPKGGTLRLQIRSSSGNQSFETFDTLNIFVLRGAGAAGMDATFDTLMQGTADEPGSLYGLVARAVRIAPDKLTYKFLLRPEARFHDGSRLTAADAAFSFNTLKEKGHPVYRSILRDFTGASAEDDHTLVVKFAPDRSRDIHLVIGGLPIFSQAWWKGRDFEATTLDAPLASGPYKVMRFEPGRFIEFERVRDYWGAKLPVNIGSSNFDRVRYEYYRERQIGFEGFKRGETNYHEEFTARFWATAYDFPAVQDGRIKRIEIPSGSPVGTQGWFFNTRRGKFADPRVREAIGLAFDFDWTNRNVMYGAYTRLTSYFEKSDMKASGAPGPDELKLLEPFRGIAPDEVFGEPYSPPASAGSGSDRNLLRRANELLLAAGCKRDGSRIRLPDGQPLELEFLDSSGALKPHTEPFQANLRRLGIESTYRQVDAAQYKRRLDDFDFDMITMALGGSFTPGDGLRNIYGSQAAQTPGSRNMPGIASPAIDAMVDRIARASSREDLNVAARCLDRLLRAGRYWIPHWYKENALVAHWDVFGRPERNPKFGTGAPGLWWWDAEKAKKIGVSG